MPVFERVRVCAALEVETFNDPNVRELGASEATGAPPLPDSAIDCGLPVASSVMLIDADRTPPAVGVNDGVIEQFAPDATVDPQVLACEKSPVLVPATAILEIFKVALPVFVSRTEEQAT